MSTAPMDLNDDEHAMWEYASKATTGKWYIAEYDGSIRSEVAGGNVEVGDHEFAGRDESHVLASCPVNVLAALQKLSAARAALRNIVRVNQLHSCTPAHAYESASTESLIIAERALMDLATPAPDAAPTTPTRNMEDPESREFWEKTEARAEAFNRRAPHWLKGEVAPDPVQSAYAECARIARLNDDLETALCIEAAALRADVTK